MCLPTYTMSAILDDVCSTRCRIPALYLPKCMISAQLYGACVCLLVWCMLNGVMYPRLYDAGLPLWCLPSCMISSYLYDVCSTASCLSAYFMFAQLYDVCLVVWCLLYCTVLCLPTFIHDVCLTIWLLLNCIMSSYSEFFISDLSDIS